MLFVLQSLGMDWEERVLPSIGNEVVKAVVAQYNAEQLLTQREKVRGALVVFAGDGRFMKTWWICWRACLNRHPFSGTA